MENKIELSKYNYKNYLPINIIAFSCASGGAQGESWGINIIDNDRTFLHFNYETVILTKDELFEINPSLKEKSLNTISEKFEEMNMGMGNKLYINKAIFPEVKEKTKDITRSDMLYIKWKKIILDIIKK